MAGDSRDDEPTLFDDITEGVDVEGVAQARRWNLGADRSRQINEQHFPGRGRPYEPREPCRWCGGTQARLTKSGGQNVVRCASPDCGKLMYNAPKHETGEQERTAKTYRSKISPEQRASILERDGLACVFCGSASGALHIGHLLSVKDGMTLGATTSELTDDANLVTMCDLCNTGVGARSVYPRTYARLMWRLIQAEIIRR